MNEPDQKRQKMTGTRQENANTHISSLPKELICKIISLSSDAGERFFILRRVCRQWDSCIRSGDAAPKIQRLSVQINRIDPENDNSVKRWNAFVVNERMVRFSGDVSGDIDKLIETMLPKKDLLLSLYLTFEQSLRISDVNRCVLEFVRCQLVQKSYIRELHIDFNTHPVNLNEFVIDEIIHRHGATLQSLKGSAVDGSTIQNSGALLKHCIVLRELHCGPKYRSNSLVFEDPANINQLVALIKKHENTWEELRLQLQTITSDNNDQLLKVLNALPVHQNRPSFDVTIRSNQFAVLLENAADTTSTWTRAITTLKIKMNYREPQPMFVPNEEGEEVLIPDIAEGFNEDLDTQWLRLVQEFNGLTKLYIVLPNNMTTNDSFFDIEKILRQICRTRQQLSAELTVIVVCMMGNPHPLEDNLADLNRWFQIFQQTATRFQCNLTWNEDSPSVVHLALPTNPIGTSPSPISFMSLPNMDSDDIRQAKRNIEAFLRQSFE